MRPLKTLRQSVKIDRNVWLSSFLDSGSWSAIRKLRKPTVPKQGRLRNLNGELVDSELRAQTLGQYLEQVQWAVHFADATPDDHELHHVALAVADGLFTESELRLVLVHLRSGKASGAAAGIAQGCPLSPYLFVSHDSGNDGRQAHEPTKGVTRFHRDA